MGEHNYFFLDEFEWEVLKLYIKYGYGSAKLYNTSFFNCLTDETVLMTLEEYADRAVDVNGVRWLEREQKGEKE